MVTSVRKNFRRFSINPTRLRKTVIFMDAHKTMISNPSNQLNFPILNVSEIILDCFFGVANELLF